MQIVQFTFDTGATVRDRVTGYEGVIDSRADYLTGCHRYGVLSLDKDGAEDYRWYDESRLVLVENIPKIELEQRYQVVGLFPEQLLESGAANLSDAASSDLSLEPGLAPISAEPPLVRTGAGPNPQRDNGPTS